MYFSVEPKFLLLLSLFIVMDKDELEPPTPAFFGLDTSVVVCHLFLVSYRLSAHVSLEDHNVSPNP
jgi:hypothetical protein